jgi:hypothetical protein
MTNTAEMTNTQLRAALDEAVRWSNWYFDGGEWWLAEQWHLKATDLQAALDARRPLADGEGV